MGQLSLKELGPLPMTLLVPLWARALETKRSQPIITDWSAVATAGALDFDFSRLRLSRTTATGACARTAIIDGLVRACCRLDPKLHLVNIGEGLDNRFGRVDNGVLQCADLDLPEVVRLRSHFYPESSRRKLISRSVLDLSWLEESSQDSVTTLFVAEGVFMYLPLERVQQLFAAIAVRFPGAHVVFDSFSPWVARIGPEFELPRYLDMRFQWGLRSGAEFESWAPGYRMVTRRSILETHGPRFGLGLRWLAAISPTLRWAHAVNWARLGPVRP